MPDIKEQKLLYHLTPLENLPSILANGLLSRADLENFTDVADPEIIMDRRSYGLENFVPFHWFAGNPFDGRVQIDHPDRSFVLIAVHRKVAARENWTIIPRHPLAGDGLTLLSYADGISAIDWDAMNKRDYRDQENKCICMAECLSPTPVMPVNFFKIFVPNERTEKFVLQCIKQAELRLEVVINGWMFHR